MDTSELVSLHQQKQQIISTELIYKLLRRGRGHYMDHLYSTRGMAKDQGTGS